MGTITNATLKWQILKSGTRGHEWWQHEFKNTFMLLLLDSLNPLIPIASPLFPAPRPPFHRRRHRPLLPQIMSYPLKLHQKLEPATEIFINQFRIGHLDMQSVRLMVIVKVEYVTEKEE